MFVHMYYYPHRFTYAYVYIPAACFVWVYIHLMYVYICISVRFFISWCTIQRWIKTPWGFSRAKWQAATSCTLYCTHRAQLRSAPAPWMHFLYIIHAMPIWRTSFEIRQHFVLECSIPNSNLYVFVHIQVSGVELYGTHAI